jgi:hypothetical protein
MRLGGRRAPAKSRRHTPTLGGKMFLPMHRSAVPACSIEAIALQARGRQHQPNEYEGTIVTRMGRDRLWPGSGRSLERGLTARAGVPDLSCKSCHNCLYS